MERFISSSLINEAARARTDGERRRKDRRLRFLNAADLENEQVFMDESMSGRESGQRGSREVGRREGQGAGPGAPEPSLPFTPAGAARSAP